MLCEVNKNPTKKPSSLRTRKVLFSLKSSWVYSEAAAAFIRFKLAAMRDLRRFTLFLCKIPF